MLLLTCTYTVNIYSNSNSTVNIHNIVSRGAAFTLSHRIKGWIKGEWFMNVKDPSIHVQVPNQGFSIFFFSSPKLTSQDRLSPCQNLWECFLLCS